MSNFEIQKEEPAPSVEEGSDIGATLSAILHELGRTNRLLGFCIRMEGGLSPLEARMLTKLMEGL